MSSSPVAYCVPVLVPLGSGVDTDDLKQREIDDGEGCKSPKSSPRVRSERDLRFLSVTDESLGFRDVLPRQKSRFALCLACDGPTHLTTLRCRDSYARACFARGDLREAELHGTTLVDDRQTRMGKRHLDSIHAIVQLARVNSSLGDLSKAEKLHRKAFKRYQSLASSTPGVLSSSVLLQMSHLAQCLNAKGEKSAALNMYRQFRLAALRNLTKTSGAKSGVDLIDALNARMSGDPLHQALRNVGLLAWTENDPDTAVAALKQVQTWRNEYLGASHPESIESSSEFAMVGHRSGLMPDEVVEIHIDAMKRWGEVVGLETHGYFRCMRRHAIWLWDLGKKCESEGVWAQTVRFFFFKLCVT